MSTYKEDFESETGIEWRPWRWASKALGIAVLVVVISGILSAAIWGIGVATSNVAGQGDAVVLKNSAVNRTQAQAQFQATFQSIAGLDRKLTDAQANLVAFQKQYPKVENGTAYDPLAEQQANLQRDVTGIKQQCINAVADYNASTRTYTLEDFRDASLPMTIDPTDPFFTGQNPSGSGHYTDYDCQPNS